MGYYLGIQDLVANALIEIVEKTGKRTVSFSQLNEYGEAIIAKLKAQNTEATLIFNRNSTNQFFHNCSNLFETEENASDIYIRLKDGISTDDLRKRFRVNIAFSILKAFISNEALEALTKVRDK